MRVREGRERVYVCSAILTGRRMYSERLQMLFAQREPFGLLLGQGWAGVDIRNPSVGSVLKLGGNQPAPRALASLRHSLQRFGRVVVCLRTERLCAEQRLCDEQQVKLLGAQVPLSFVSQALAVWGRAAPAGGRGITPSWQAQGGPGRLAWAPMCVG